MWEKFDGYKVYTVSRSDLHPAAIKYVDILPLRDLPTKFEGALYPIRNLLFEL